MASPTTYELFAVKYAHHERPAADNFVFRDDVHDGPGPLDFFVWVAKLGGADLRHRHRVLRGDRAAARAPDHPQPKGWPRRARHRCRAGRGRGRHPPALRSRRQFRDLPARHLPPPGPRDGLRHRALHVPPAAAHAVRRRERHRHGARALSWPGGLPRRRRGAGTWDQPASGRRPQPRPAVRARAHRARLGRGGLGCRPFLRQHGERQPVPDRAPRRRDAGGPPQVPAARREPAACRAGPRSPGDAALPRAVAGPRRHRGAARRGARSTD